MQWSRKAKCNKYCVVLINFCEFTNYIYIYIIYTLLIVCDNINFTKECLLPNDTCVDQNEIGKFSSRLSCVFIWPDHKL